VASVVVEEARIRAPVEEGMGKGNRARARAKGSVTDEEGSTAQVAEPVGRDKGIVVVHITDVHLGEFMGDIMGEVTGSVRGEVAGNVTGEATDNVTGDVKGEVNGRVNVTHEVMGGQKWVLVED
jgi:hypothetical protein